MGFYDAYLTIAKSPADQIRTDYQDVVNDQWEVSSSLYQISEELVFGTQQYSTVDVRINHALNTTTGTKLGDDYREIIFPDFDHAKGLGYRYQFNNNVWLTINSDLYKFLTASATVKRCNNVLKWKDESGVLRVEPCVIDYDYSGTMVDYDQTINVPSGNLVITAQYNQYTGTIGINNRFLFGGQAYKVKAVNNFFQSQTGAQGTVPLVYIEVYKDVLDAGDDVSNNIPVSHVDYTITLNTTAINQSIGYTTQLNAVVKRNGDIVPEGITWTSSSMTVATVSNSGVLNLLANGTATITATMTNNSSVTAICTVIVQAVPTPVREIRFSPLVTSLLQGTSQAYTAYLYVNGVQQPTALTFSGSGAPSGSYSLTSTDPNSFTVANIKRSTVDLIVSATDGTTTNTLQIVLKGVF